MGGGKLRWHWTVVPGPMSHGASVVCTADGPGLELCWDLIRRPRDASKCSCACRSHCVIREYMDNLYIKCSVYSLLYGCTIDTQVSYGASLPKCSSCVAVSRHYLTAFAILHNQVVHTSGALEPAGSLILNAFANCTPSWATSLQQSATCGPYTSNQTQKE